MYAHVGWQQEEAGFCDRTVVSGLGAVMAQLAADSDIGGGADTPFHRSRPASVPIAAYVALMRWHYACSLECFVIAFVYLGRALDSEPRLALCWVRLGIFRGDFARTRIQFDQRCADFDHALMCNRVVAL